MNSYQGADAMGDDEFSATKPCICGLGKIVTTVTTPDHRWPSAYNTSRSYRFDCQSCSQQYIFDHGRVVRRADHAASREAWDKWYAEAKKLDESSQATVLRTEFASRLAGLKTKKAVHDYLVQHGIVTDKYGAFTRRYQAPAAFVKEIHYSRLPIVARLLGKDPTFFQSQWDGLQAMQAAIPSVPSITTSD
jgi:hypothetical protein